MSRPIRVLILEDNPNDAELMVFELRRSGFLPTWQRVETEAEFLAHLDASLDVILADYSLPQFDGMRALRLLRERNLDVPFIVVTGALGDEKAAGCVKQGAADFLMKDRLARLGSAVAHALEEKRLRNEKGRGDERLTWHARVLASVHDAVMAADNMEIITAWNPAAEVLYGWKEGEALGRNSDELLKTEYVQLARSVVIARLLRDGSLRTEFRQHCRDGLVVDVESNLVVTRSASGQVTGYVAANRDITERKRIEQELARHQMKLEELVDERTRALAAARDRLLAAERLAAVGQIAGNVANQLREPLAAAREAVATMKLRAAAKLDPSSRRMLEALETVVDRGNHVVASLLDFAEARPPQPTNCSLTYLVTEALEEADLPLTIKRKVVIPDRLPPVSVDRVQVLHALVNIIGNCHDALAELVHRSSFAVDRSSNEERTSDERRESRPTIDITCASAGAHVEVRITDNGPGISPEVKPHLFEPLFTTRSHGAGLGLAIARNFIATNKGTISIESEPGNGTTVRVTLPCA